MGVGKGHFGGDRGWKVVWFTTFLKLENKTEGSFGILRVEFGGILAIRFAAP